MSASAETEWPPRASLRDISEPLPQITPGLIDPAYLENDAVIEAARSAVDAFNIAVRSNDAEKLAECFYEQQAYWRDIVALTSHLRTINKPDTIAAALIHLKNLRGLATCFEVSGEPNLVAMSPSMMFIDCEIAFSTSSPALDCAGRIVLLPIKSENSVTWKVWVLSTWVEDLIDFPENQNLLSVPGKDFDGVDVIETDVLIIGAGTSGLMAAARLKAFDVEYLVLDRNTNIGDNWAGRYDSMRFHVPTSNCEMPYAYYSKEFQHPHRLSKDDVAAHLQNYAKNFHLNVVTSAVILSTVFNPIKKNWILQVQVAGNVKTIMCKHIVQATGIGSGKPNIPAIADEHLFEGVRVHSSQYRNAVELKDQGAKSVTIVGSANTAFDVMRDLWEAGMKATMIARSPTYLLPWDYVMNPHGIGAYETMSLDRADRLLNTFPSMLDGQFSHGLFSYLASKEPDRYSKLYNAGFPVIDSRNPSANILHNLFERGGGHYVDVGGIDLISDGKVKVRGMVEPVAYTKSGLRLSDNSVIETDAVVWCTGFSDTNVRGTTQEVLGARQASDTELLGPAEIASRLDASWGVDHEGEVRGIGKRHLNMENFWVLGGPIQYQRWWSRAMAQQIKLHLEGGLPPAYRDTHHKI